MADVAVPNGASMRPNTAALHYIVKRAMREPVYVYAVKAGMFISRLLPSCQTAEGVDEYVGVELPGDLILVHEFRDHYSMQARREMTVNGMYCSQYPIPALDAVKLKPSELDEKITRFLSTQGECLTKEAWRTRYPRPTERY